MAILARLPRPGSAGYPGIVPIFAAAVLAYAITTWAWPKLVRVPQYSEPVFGLVPLVEADKDRDFRALYLFLGLTAATGILLGTSFRALSAEGPGGPVGKALNGLLLLALVPAGWRLGAALLQAEGPQPPLESVGLVGIVFLAALGLRRHRQYLTEAHVYHIGGGGLLAPALGLFGGLGLATLLGRTSPALCARWADKAPVFAWGGAAVGLALAALLLALSRDLDALRRRIFRLLFALQVPVPLLFAILLPPPYLENGKPTAMPFTPALPVALGLLGLLALALLGRKYRRWTRQATTDPGSWADVLSPLGLSAIAIFATLPTLPCPLLLYADPFHFGEQVVPWQQWTAFGKRPYLDLVPIHGLMPLLRGFFGHVFFTDTAAAVAPAETLLLALAVAATFLTLSELVGVLPALLLGFGTPCIDRLYFLAPGLLLLANGRLLARPQLWLGVWFVVCPLMVFYNAGVGPAFVLASLVPAGWMLVRLAATNRRRLVAVVVSLATVAAVAYWLTPLGAVVTGFVRFVLDAYPTNVIANSHPWAFSTQSRPQNSASAAGQFVWELLRFGWVGVAVAAGAVLWRELARPAGERRRPLVCLCLLAVPTLLLSSGWTLCQIIPGHLARTGSLTAVVCLTVLPVLLLVGRRGVAAAATALGIAALAGGINAVELNTRVFNLPFSLAPAFTPPQRETLLAKPFALNVPPAGLPLVDGKDLGMPRLGRGYVLHADCFKELVELKQVLDVLLRPGETFFDLANKTAMYYYLDLPIPVRYAASNTAPNRATQAQVLHDLERSRPPVVLLEARQCWALPLLSPYLYQDCLLRYSAVPRGQFTLLVAPDRVPGAGPPGSRGQLAVLDEAVALRDLGKTAAAWGRSWPRLARQFEEVQALDSEHPTGTQDVRAGPGAGYVPTGAQPGMSYPLGDLSLRGRDANFLWLDFAAERPAGGADPVLEVRWTARTPESPPDFSASSPGTDTPSEGWLRLTASGPGLLIPVGTHPRWLLAERLDSLQLVLRNPESCASFRFKAVRLLRLPPP
jgi:hypothetical protein